MLDAEARTSRTRQLRQSSTDAERKLWALVRNRQLEGCKFRRQIPVDRYFADFLCEERKLIVELDGGQHVEQQAYDAARTAVLESCGYRVLRFWNNDVLRETEGVVLAIQEALKLARP